MPESPDTSVRSEAPGADYQRLFRLSGPPSAILTLGAETRFIDANDNFLRALGLERIAVVGRTLAQVFSPPTAATIAASIVQAAQFGDAVTIKVSGAEAALRGDFRVQPLAGDQPCVLLGIERRRSALAGRRQIAFLDDLSSLSTELTYIFDLFTEETRYVNAHLSKLLGYAKDEVVDLASVFKLVHEDDTQAFQLHLESFPALSDDAVTHGVFRLRAADGSWRWIDNRARVLSRNRHGQVQRLIGCAMDITESRKVSDDLAAMSQALLQAEEKERRRVARELHDSTAQYLVAMDFGLCSLERSVVANARESEVLLETRRLLSLALREIRTFSYLLHPPDLAHHGLESTLRVFVGGFARRSGLSAEVQTSGVVRAMGPAAELALFRVAQEAIMNVHRHAHAQRVFVRLTRSPQAVLLEIEDDGVGATISPDLWTDAEHMGVGVAGMRARMSQLGGTLTIKGGGGGTIVRARLPLANNEALDAAARRDKGALAAG